MGPETKVCQHCKQEFTIEPIDFEFYDRIKVPAPTFCPECRFQRRLMFVNEMKLYKRRCDLCQKDTLSVFSADKPFVVYCSSCWWSDKWDGLEFGQDYDPGRNFFEQLRQLHLKTPMPTLLVEEPSMVNSPYNNYAGYLKNCYLVFNGAEDENCYYSWLCNFCKDSMDGFMIDYDELCYNNINCFRSFQTHFSEDCEDCHDVYFSKDLAGCSDCFGCVGLRRKQHYIFNKPHSKEEYRKKIAEFRLSSYQELEKIKKEAREFWLRYPQKFTHNLHNVNSDGDYLFHCKNVHDSYIAVAAEDSRYVQFLTVEPSKDCYDYTSWGENAELIYECMGIGEDASNMKFNFGCWKGNTINVEYSTFLMSSKNMFGCIGMRKKEYCILNKQYSKEDYEKLRTQIIEDMNKNPYIDSKGRVFKYGEFFPYDLSLFDYNESTAKFYFPLSKEKVIGFGWRWKEDEPITYQISKEAKDLSDDIKDVGDEILKEIIACAKCGKGFRIVSGELQLLRRWGFPLPRKCFDCRHVERLRRTNTPRFYHRKCAKCQKEVISTFSPEKPDIIYCEACYQNEIV